jgi:hypothetical protein
MLQSPGIVILKNGMFHWPVCISRVKEAVWAFINKPINISYLKKPTLAILKRLIYDQIIYLEVEKVYLFQQHFYI